MITLVSGTDSVTINNYIKALRSKYGRSKEYTLESPINYVGFKDLVGASGLFDGPSKIIIIKAKKDSDIDFADDLITKLLRDKQITVVIEASKAKLSKAVLSKFESAQIKKFDLLPSRVAFKLSDEILVNQNKAMALKLINGMSNVDEEFYLIIGAIQYTIRAYFSYRYKNKFSKALNPFVIRKLTAIKYGESSMKDIHSKLLDLEIKSKTTNESLKNLLMDFVISI